MKRAAAVACLVLQACATQVAHERVAGWPTLRVIEHRVPEAEMHRVCDQYAPPLMTPRACAVINLTALRCDIWLTENPLQSSVEHERLHCAGYDHVGKHDLADMLKQYEKTLKR